MRVLGQAACLLAALCAAPVMAIHRPCDCQVDCVDAGTANVWLPVSCGECPDACASNDTLTALAAICEDRGSTVSPDTSFNVCADARVGPSRLVIIGAVIGGLAILGAVGVALFCLCYAVVVLRRKKRQQQAGSALPYAALATDDSPPSYGAVQEQDPPVKGMA